MAVTGIKINGINFDFDKKYFNQQSNAAKGLRKKNFKDSVLEINIDAGFDLESNKELITNFLGKNDVEITKENIEFLSQLANSIKIEARKQQIHSFRFAHELEETNVGEDPDYLLLLDLEDTFDNLSQENFESSIEKVVNTHQTEKVTEETISRLIYFFCIARPIKTDIYIDFFLALKEKIPELYEKFKFLVVRETHDKNSFERERYYVAGVILRKNAFEMKRDMLKLFKSNVFWLDLISDEVCYSSTNSDSKNKPSNKIEKNNNNSANSNDDSNYSDSTSNYSENTPNNERNSSSKNLTPEKSERLKYIDSLEKPLLLYYEEVKKNDWKVFYQLLKDGVNEQKICEFIREDNVEAFEKFNIDLSKNFGRIPESYFDVNDLTSSGARLIEYAAFYGSEKCFDYFQTKSKNKNDLNDKLPRFSIAGNQIEMLKKCDKLNLISKTSLVMAVSYHRSDIVNWLLLDKKVSFDMNVGNLSLRHCNFHSILPFLKAGADSSSFLYESIRDSNINAARFLLKLRNININIVKEQGTPLICASLNGLAEIVELILKNFSEVVDINLQHINDKMNCLHSACKKGHLEVVKILIEKAKIFNSKLEIDLLALDGDKKTAIEVAFNNGHFEIVEYLYNFYPEKLVKELKEKEKNPFSCYDKKLYLPGITDMQKVIDYGHDLSYSFLRSLQINRVDFAILIFDNFKKKIDFGQKDKSDSTNAFHVLGMSDDPKYSEIMIRVLEYIFFEVKNKDEPENVTSPERAVTLILHKCDDDYHTPIYYICRKGKMDIVCYLFEKVFVLKFEDEEANQHIQNMPKKELVTAAIQSQNIDVLAFLVEKLKPAEEINSILLFACHNSDDVEMFKLLISFSQKMKLEAENSTNIIDYRALFKLAAKNYKKNICKFLFENHNENKEHFFNLACSNGLIEIVDCYLMKNGNEIPNQLIERSLFDSCRKGQIEVVKKLIDFSNNKIDILQMKTEKEGYNLLHLAAISPSKELLQFFINSKMFDLNSIDSRGYNSLFLAFEAKNYRNSELLLYTEGIEKSIEVKDHKSLEIIAYLSGQVELVELYMQIFKNKQNQGVPQKGVWMQPSHAACFSGSVKLVDWMISKNFLRNINTVKGMTILHTAVQSNSPDLVSKILNLKFQMNGNIYHNNSSINNNNNNGNKIKKKNKNKGNNSNNNNNKNRSISNIAIVNINATDNGGNTALHMAIQKENLDIVRILLNDQNIDVNIRNHEKKTPLHLAVLKNHLEIIKLILSDKNVDDSIKDGSKQKALFYATEEAKSLIRRANRVKKKGKNDKL